jgi:bla regulator protein BlaR1
MQFILDALLTNAVVALFLAVLAALVGRCVGRPALAHVLWLIVLLKLITPPLFSIHWPNSAPAPAEESAVADEPAAIVAVTPVQSAEPKSLEEDGATTRQHLAEALVALREERESVLATWNNGRLLRTLLAGIWASGTLLWFSVFAWRIVRFHRLLGLGQPADDALQAQAEDLASRIGLYRCPQVWIVPGRVSPLLWMLGKRGRLVLPQDLLDSLNHDQRAALLTHEMAHAHRLDHWVRWIELCALGLYWWNPVAWWARRELHQAEEECCDAWVVWILPGAARAYAKALLQTVTFLDARPCLPPVASGAGHVSLLKRRLAMIVKEPLSPRLPKPLFCAALLWGSLVLPFVPEQVVASSMFEETGQTTTRQSSQSVEQRIQAIENKLDKVLKALDAQNSAESNAKKSAEDARTQERRIQESENRAKVIAERAQALANEARARALQQAETSRAAAEEARRALESARGELRKQAAAQQEKLKAIEEKTKIIRDDKKAEKSEKTERKLIIDLDPKAKADLERVIKEKLGAELKMDELHKIIQDSVDPAKMRQIQTKVHEMLRKTLDEKRKDMDKAFDEARKAMEVQRNLLQKQLSEELKSETEPRARIATPARPATPARVVAPERIASPARDGDLRDVQRRLERLEQRLDKVISSLEAQRGKKDGSN